MVIFSLLASARAMRAPVQGMFLYVKEMLHALESR